MTSGLETGLKPEVLSSFFLRLADIFQDMDKAYSDLSGVFAPSCSDCEDSCCNTRFYHYTLVEVFYLLRGFSGLEPDEREVLIEKAHSLLREMKAYDLSESSEPFKGACPLLQDSGCRLYEYRPMVCRLHGIPWKMEGRSGELSGSGCHLFKGSEDLRLDRTPHYRALAVLERELRLASGFSDRISFSVADILCLPLPDMEGIA